MSDFRPLTDDELDAMEELAGYDLGVHAEEGDCERLRFMVHEIRIRRVEASAIDAWRDAKCASIWVSVPSMDAGGYGCSECTEYQPAVAPPDRNGGHHEDCPVEHARVAFFAATQRRRELERAARPDLERSASQAVGESKGDK